MASTLVEGRARAFGEAAAAGALAISAPARGFLQGGCVEPTAPARSAGVTTLVKPIRRVGRPISRPTSATGAPPSKGRKGTTKPAFPTAAKGRLALKAAPQTTGPAIRGHLKALFSPFNGGTPSGRAKPSVGLGFLTKTKAVAVLAAARKRLEIPSEDSTFYAIAFHKPKPNYSGCCHG